MKSRKSRKSRKQRYRLKVNERRQVVADIVYLMGRCKQDVVDLEHQIEFEQERSGMDDVNHCTYPTFAKAVIQRRDNLKNTVRKLESKLEEARNQLAKACEELKKINRTKSAERELKDINEIGLMLNMGFSPSQAQRN